MRCRDAKRRAGNEPSHRAAVNVLRMHCHPSPLLVFAVLATTQVLTNHRRTHCPLKLILYFLAVKFRSQLSKHQYFVGRQASSETHNKNKHSNKSNGRNRSRQWLCREASNNKLRGEREVRSLPYRSCREREGAAGTGGWPRGKLRAANSERQAPSKRTASTDAVERLATAHHSSP